jgi:hypothetical protein
MLTEEEFKKLQEKKDELKKELQIINKKLRYKKSNDYQKKEENMEYCQYCEKKINKYSLDTHNKTKTHVLLKKIKENESNIKNQLQNP